ncbi:hypothetical protein DSO57_1014532 [Entomophthora muscae]|uniref:Uncharacterized protein n=1 Tax=Entomophthora muscae TaxID=34485 RepID=A0ACC2U3R0_9FUNG|nr:hypothetical protein DSO57_1014532 [Entomophthora muscae]
MNARVVKDLASSFSTLKKINNSFPLETRAQDWDSNPDPEFLQATSPMDQGNTHPRFLGTESLQAEAPAKSQSKNTSTGLTMVMPEEELLKLPNEGRESSSVNFMNLKSSCVTNKIQLPKENTVFRPNPVTTAQNQENKVTDLDILPMREHPAKVPFCCSCTWPPALIFPNILMKPLCKILSLEAGCYICL